MAPIEITTELVFNQPPTSGRYLIQPTKLISVSHIR